MIYYTIIEIDLIIEKKRISVNERKKRKKEVWEKNRKYSLKNTQNNW